VRKKLSVLALILLLVSCSSPKELSKIIITEVIDGDTVRLDNGRLLRYIGIDTPEIRLKKGADFVYSPQPFSLEAKEFNKELVEGKEADVEFDVQKTDRYNRLLGYCFVDGVLVNARLLEEGYAFLYTYPPNVKYAEKFVEAQKKAKENKKGMWAGLEAVEADKAHSYIGQTRTVQGKVLNAYKSSKCIFLNFGADWHSDFTAVIFKSSFDAFYDKGIDPVTFYKGKTIRVNGRIREYNGPEIVVNAPYEIEVVDESN